MSEVETSPETEVAESTTEETLVTQEMPEEKEPSPEPLYKDEEEPAKEEDAEPAKEEPEKEEPKGDEKEPEKEEEKKADEKPEEFDSLDAPEDSLLSDSDMERIVAHAKQQGLSKEGAQQYVDIANQALKDFQEDQTQTHMELSEQWIDQVKSDKELGGEKFDDSIKMANRCLKKFGSEELIKDLNQTKFGNHPEVVRMFSRIGKAMSPDTLHVSEKYNEQKSVEEIFYPDQS